jgi:hypothetical protein
VLVFSVIDGLRTELWMWNGADRTARRFGDQESATPFNAQFSPDGRWIAYTLRGSGNADGNTRLYVQSATRADARPFQIGRDEDLLHHPLWIANDRLLFFPGGQSTMAVNLRLEPSFAVLGKPAPYPGRGLTVNVAPTTALNHDMAPNGRFVTIAEVDGDDVGTAGGNVLQSRNIVVVSDWFDELNRLVPR